MPEAVAIDIFAEDRAHEAFLRAIIHRIASETQKQVELNVRSALGGHPRAFGELDIYQISVRKGGMPTPDILVVAIDGNCKGFNEARKNITDKVVEPLASRLVPATPDPHVERWFLADLNSFHTVIGNRPKIRKGKCDRFYYKNAFEQAVRAGGNPVTLGGIEFAEDIVNVMDLYNAGKDEPSLGHFIDAFRNKLQTLDP